jgi:hypothetical protein
MPIRELAKAAAQHTQNGQPPLIQMDEATRKKIDALSGSKL